MGAETDRKIGSELGSQTDTETFELIRRLRAAVPAAPAAFCAPGVAAKISAWLAAAGDVRQDEFLQLCQIARGRRTFAFTSPRIARLLADLERPGESCAE